MIINKSKPWYKHTPFNNTPKTPQRHQKVKFHGVDDSPHVFAWEFPNSRPLQSKPSTRRWVNELEVAKLCPLGLILPWRMVFFLEKKSFTSIQLGWISWGIMNQVFFFPWWIGGKGWQQKKTSTVLFYFYFWEVYWKMCTFLFSIDLFHSGWSIRGITISHIHMMFSRSMLSVNLIFCHTDFPPLIPPSLNDFLKWTLELGVVRIYIRRVSKHGFKIWSLSTRSQTPWIPWAAERHCTPIFSVFPGVCSCWISSNVGFFMWEDISGISFGLFHYWRKKRLFFFLPQL